MPLFAINELKRLLENVNTPLSKRMRLAKIVTRSQNFPVVKKQLVIAKWVNGLVHDNKIKSEELREILEWLNNVENLTFEFQLEITKAVALFILNNNLMTEDINNITEYFKNGSVFAQLSLSLQPDTFLKVTTTKLLKYLVNKCSENVQIVETIFNIIVKYYKLSKRKLDFVATLINRKYLEICFLYLKTACQNSVIVFCENVLFTSINKDVYSNILNHLIRRDSVDQDENHPLYQLCLQILGAFFNFTNSEHVQDHEFLMYYIHAFVTCYRSESQLVFAFIVMATDLLNMPQLELVPTANLIKINFQNHNDEVKRHIFLIMLKTLLQNEIYTHVSLLDVPGTIEPIERKEPFMSFLQSVLLGQIKLAGNLDITTLEIINTAIKLNPSIIVTKIYQIIPHIMTVKKSSSILMKSYTEMMNCLLETLFKLSQGANFLNHMIPKLELLLKMNNTEQIELKRKLQETDNNEETRDQITSKIITANDIFPPDCVALYGKLISEMLFRQHKYVLISLQNNLENNCLTNLDAGDDSPSVIILTEMITAVLATFLHHNKIATHVVQLNVAKEFWQTLENFEHQCLNKFGECILKLNYNSSLVVAFLKLCVNISQLKVLNIKYNRIKLEVTDNLLPFLHKERWLHFFSTIQETKANIVWIQLCALNTTANEILAKRNRDKLKHKLVCKAKANILKQISNYPQILISNDNYLVAKFFRKLDRKRIRQLSELLLNTYQQYANMAIFKMDVLNNNRLIETLLQNTFQIICECIQNTNILSDALKLKHFSAASFVKDNDARLYFNHTTVLNKRKIKDMVEIIKLFNIGCLQENTQLTAIFVLLIVKKCCNDEELQQNIDCILWKIYGYSCPDLYQIFSTDIIFDFEDSTMLDLLKLTQDETLILENILVLAVKNVRRNPTIVSNIVDIVLKVCKGIGRISTIQCFKESVFKVVSSILKLITLEKKVITTSPYRSILSNLQGKLYEALLDSFRNIDFSSNNRSLVFEESNNTENSALVTAHTAAALNAMEAFTFIMLKCCEPNGVGELMTLDWMLNGLEFFLTIALETIQNASSRSQHLEISIHLLNITLCNIKKFESHEILGTRDNLHLQIWQCVKSRMHLLCSCGGMDSINDQYASLAEIPITLKFLAELSSVHCFQNNFVGDLFNKTLLKKPSFILRDSETARSVIDSHKVAKFLLEHCLNGNIVEAKCVTMTKLITHITTSIIFWMRQHYDCEEDGPGAARSHDASDGSLKSLKILDPICELLSCDLEILSFGIIAAKKIPLNCTLLDSIFELLQVMCYHLGRQNDVSFLGFVLIFQSCVDILNKLLLSREELLEDRWPIYLQCYTEFVSCLCNRSTLCPESDGHTMPKLTELAQSIEKLTQFICKRKAHVSQISVYTIADLCTLIEKAPPPQEIQQHIMNSISLFVQVSDSRHLAFLRRSMAGSIGRATVSNVYATYKRYHKYVGNT